MEKYFFVKTAELTVFANFLFICLLCFNMVKHVSLKLFKTNQQKPQEKNTLNLLNVWKTPWKTKAKPNQKKQKQRNHFTLTRISHSYFYLQLKTAKERYSSLNNISQKPHIHIKKSRSVRASLPADSPRRVLHLGMTKIKFIPQRNWV